MMLPTHVLVGLTIGSILFVLSPDVGLMAVLGAVIGSIVPDLDMYAGHRRTLHYPTGYLLLALPLLLIVLYTMAPWSSALLVAVISAGVHCQMDRLGGGLELRPWEQSTDHAVYDHVFQRWRPAHRWIRYDGAPEDVALAVVLGLPLLFVWTGPIRWLILVLLGVSLVYGLLRQRLPDLVPYVLRLVPDAARDHVPGRYQGTDSDEQSLAMD